MEIINFFNCKDHYEARQKEQEYFELLSATLNSIEPLLLSKIITTNNKIESSSISPINNENKQKLSYKYYCEECEYGTCRKSNIDSHMSCAKHHKTILDNARIKNITNKIKHKYYCEKCDKMYSDRAGIWRHNKKCVEHIEHIEHVEINNTELIMMLIKENKDMRDALIDSYKTLTHIKH